MPALEVPALEVPSERREQVVCLPEECGSWQLSDQERLDHLLVRYLGCTCSWAMTAVS